ncbi:unnamed protein product [Mesocestoides corti]|uniref:Protein krueppel n=1 Tax=Mesocestoides corti TaxID=53468 RepID=A0A0R3UCA3_MESCO|nr:unnamed protein product [Mesocestoides corti]
MWSAFEKGNPLPTVANADQAAFQAMWRSAVSSVEEGVLQKQLCDTSLLRHAIVVLSRRFETLPSGLVAEPSFLAGSTDSGGSSPPSFPNPSHENSFHQSNQTSWLTLPFLPVVQQDQFRHQQLHQQQQHAFAKMEDLQPPMDLSKEKSPKYDKFSIPHLLGEIGDENARPLKACFECSLCGRSYATKAGLQRHQNQCTRRAAEDEVVCEAATPPASSSPDAVEQASTSPMSISRQYTCHVCAKVYYSMSALKMHIRTHTLPCKCSVCGKAFSRMWLLNGHLRTHTGEKPFACRVCQRAFADRSNLRAHMQTHSEVKRYRCEDCGKTFSRMGLLTKHSRAGCSSQDVAPASSMSPDSRVWNPAVSTSIFS